MRNNRAISAKRNSAGTAQTIKRSAKLTEGTDHQSKISGRAILCQNLEDGKQDFTVELEHYFDFVCADDIRLKGTRMGIETILYAYIHQQRTAEEIAQIYPQITLEQIYATILYYLHNQAQVTQYLADWLDYCTQVEREQDENPLAIVVRLKQIKAERSLTAHG
ncbi:DUF433 domain-containing protein [Phormidesmis sp. 146-35]